MHVSAYPVIGPRAPFAIDPREPSHHNGTAANKLVFRLFSSASLSPSLPPFGHVSPMETPMDDMEQKRGHFAPKIRPDIDSHHVVDLERLQYTSSE